MNRAAWLVPVMCLGCLSAGCVTRRVLITSEPPGAIVYRNGQYLGPTPVEDPFVYYGKYRYRLVKDGYEALDVTQELDPPWYQYPGPDFVSENLIPYPFRDVKALHYQLQPLQAVRPDDIRARAEALREEGSPIRPPEGTPPPQRRATPRPAPAPPPITGPSAPVARSPEAP